MKIINIALITIFAGLTAACAPQGNPDGSGLPAPVETYSEPYLLAPLDTIVVTHNDKHVEKLQVTLEDNLEYGGSRFPALGRTPDQIEKALKDRDATIASVEIKEFKGNRISVTGEVNIQTNFDLQDTPMRVLDAIASAGGFTPLADTDSVRLVRHTAGIVHIYELNMHDVQRGNNLYQDMLLEPGDQIFIPRSFL